MGSHVEIDERLLKTARARRDSSSIYLRLRMSVDAQRLMDVLEEVLGTLPEDDEGLAEVDWMRIGDDVLLRLRDGADYARELLDLARDLQEQGISGRFESYRRPKAPPAVHASDYYVMARLRVGCHDEQLMPTWRVDETVLHAVVRRVARWCMSDAPDAAAVLTPRDMGQFVLPADDDHAGRLIEHLHHPMGFASLRPVGGSTFLQAARQTGEVMLMASPRSDAKGAWKPLYKGLREVLCDTAPHLAYALVKHGVYPLGDPLEHDWPRRLDLDPRWRPHWQWEDRWVPDAFVLQALGPGYDGRVPTAPSYSAQQLHKTTILEHRDPEAWFTTPFVPRGTDLHLVINVKPPAVLDAARAELAAILATPERERPNTG